MSKFYGTLISDAGEIKTKTGHNYMRATAQTWQGSVSVVISEADHGDMHVVIEIGPGSTPVPSREVGYARLSGLLSGGRLSLRKG